MELIDTHAHLDEEAFGADCGDVLANARLAGVSTLITIGTSAASSRRAVELAGQHSMVFASVGIHPNYASQAHAGDWDVIERLVDEPKVVAIGETGLDRHWDFSPFDLQIEYFRRHIDLSRRSGKPFVVHCRDAEDEAVGELQAAAGPGPLRGVMHSFCGAEEHVRACLDLGLYVSFAGMLTYKKNDALRSVAALVPLERVLVETDSPYLAPVPNRGKRNEPAFVAHTAACLADVYGISLEELAAATTQNARQLFGLPKMEAGTQPAD